MSKIEQLSPVVLGPASEFFFDMRRLGWKLVKNVWTEKEDKFEFEIQAHSPFKKGERILSRRALIRRANAAGNIAGQVHAERFLQQQDRLSEEWSTSYCQLFFLGTIWLNAEKKLVFPCVSCHDIVEDFDKYFLSPDKARQWRLHFRPLDAAGFHCYLACVYYKHC